MQTASGVLAILAWAAFIVWTARRLWRKPTGPRGRYVYGVGVKWIGGYSSVLMAVLFTLDLNRRGIPLLGNTASSFLVIFAVSLPLALWAGYVSGRLLAAVLGVSDDR